MPFLNISAAVIPLTADGDTAGNVTISAATVLRPGTVVNLYSAAAGSLECIVTQVSDMGVVGLRPTSQNASDHKQLNYGQGGDLSAWTVVGSAKLFLERQIVPVEPVLLNKPAI